MRSPAALALCLAACAPEARPSAPEDAGTPARPDVPPGTVLTVEGLPLGAAEVDRVAAWVGELRPQYTLPHRRRIALTNVFLPLLAFRARHPAERAAARAAALAAEPPAGEAETWAPADGRVARTTGDWTDLGLLVWGTASELEPGTWSGPFEDVGRFVRVRLEEPMGSEPAFRRPLHVTVAAFSYTTVPPWDRSDVERALDTARLEILEPAWLDVVPEAWKYRMRDSSAEDASREGEESDP